MSFSVTTRRRPPRLLTLAFALAFALYAMRLSTLRRCGNLLSLDGGGIMRGVRVRLEPRSSRRLGFDSFHRGNFNDFRDLDPYNFSCFSEKRNDEKKMKKR